MTDRARDMAGNLRVNAGSTSNWEEFVMGNRDRPRKEQKKPKQPKKPARPSLN